MKVNFLTGIDMSISSPAFCVYNIEKKSVFFYVFSNKVKKRTELNFKNFHFIIEPQPKKDKNDFDNFKRYLNISETIFNNLRKHCQSDTFDNLIYFEDYSFASKGKVFNIAETTGMVKYLVMKNGWEFDTVPPSEWKKGVVGKGNAKKEEVYQFLKNLQSTKDLVQFLEESGFPYKKNGLIEDICDSLCILLWILKKAFKDYNIALS